MKILNLYAGIGGNRKLWGDDHEITAVELDEPTAKVYQDYFPNDKMIIADAHQYLLDHYKEFDFIWSSPPCPSHSRARFWRYGKTRSVYPDMRLYQEVLFLIHHTKKPWCVENVQPYYRPLLPGVKIGRHMFWTNFAMSDNGHKSRDIRQLSGTSIHDKRLRNMVDPELGLHILNCAINSKCKTEQLELFEVKK